MQKLDIVFVIPGLAFQGDTLDTKSLGGSETAGLYMARELARLGHIVTVFSNCDQPGVYDKVIYQHISGWLDYTRMISHDVTIIQRMPEGFANTINSKLRLLWCHDLALGRTAQLVGGAVWNIDKIMVLSEYMKVQYQSAYNLPDDLYYVTRNGIDRSLFIGMGDIIKDPNKLICAARPERGIDNLVNGIMPKIWAKNPEIKLYLCGYDNKVPHLADFCKNIDNAINQSQGRIVWLGNLTKKELYRHYKEASLYVYPTPSEIGKDFNEISCISAMEAMACGLPIVTSNSGALPETIPAEAGVFIEGDAWSHDYQDNFVDAALSILGDTDRYNKAVEAGINKASTLDWSALAETWTEDFISMINKMNDNPYRLAHHFIRRSDIMAAKKLIEPLNDEHAMMIKDNLQKHWGFIDSPEKTKEHYEKIGNTHTDCFEQSANEPRYRYLLDHLKAHPEYKRILDYGCAHGSYAVNLANQVGREWVGVDVDKISIDWAERNRIKRGAEPRSMAFVQGDENVDLSAHKPFDLLILYEVLEHIAKPWEAIDKLEKWVRMGGDVCITVPFGPWEFDSYDTYPHRCHVWEFDCHDIRDIFINKKNFRYGIMPYGMSSKTGEPLGWIHIEYTVDIDKPCGIIDIERKLGLQRPRQSVSVNIIAGPKAEDTMRMTLESIKYIADEVIIGDSGMTENSHKIVNELNSFGFPLWPNVKIVKCSNPTIEGFETPRNEVLANSIMDWVLWIDTDEKLIDSMKMNKYLHDNIFHGYSIRQHHFACDTIFKPDMPVRLFRNRPNKDNKMLRFFGMIHEHPEFAVNEGPGLSIVLGDLHIAHMGYLAESIRRDRFFRNYPLLQRDIAKYPDRLLQKHFICRDNMILVMYEMQQNGNQVTENIKAKCRETIEIYQKYFLGKAGFLEVDTIQYYSNAVSLLGEGFDMALQIKADKTEAKPNGVERIRFLNIEDAEKEIMARARKEITPFIAKVW